MYDVEHDTNLNGLWNKEENLTQRAIAICNATQPVDDCFRLDAHGNYELLGSTVKVEKTKIFLGHRPDAE